MRVSVALPRGRTIKPRTKASSQEPLVRGFTRVPASRRYGAPTSLIGGRPFRSVISIFDRSGLNEAAGVGGVSRILAIAGGGCLYGICARSGAVMTRSSARVRRIGRLGRGSTINNAKRSECAGADSLGSERKGLGVRFPPLTRIYTETPRKSALKGGKTDPKRF